MGLTGPLLQARVAPDNFEWVSSAIDSGVFGERPSSTLSILPELFTREQPGKVPIWRRSAD